MGGWTCSSTRTSPATAATGASSVRRSRSTRASRTSTASRDTPSSTTREQTGKCFRVRCVRRSFLVQTRWSSIWSRSTTVSSPSTRPSPSTILHTSSSTPSLLLSMTPATWRLLRRSATSNMTPGEMCSSWWLRSPVTLLTFRVRGAREPADQDTWTGNRSVTCQVTWITGVESSTFYEQHIATLDFQIHKNNEKLADNFEDDFYRNL